MDKERILKLLDEYGVKERFINDLFDEIMECIYNETQDAERWRDLNDLIGGECEQCPVKPVCLNTNYCILNTVVYHILASPGVPCAQ